MIDKPILQQFDQVELLTTRRVSYLSDLPGKIPDPHGIWTVIGFVDGEALLAKKSAMIRIPISDLKKLAGYDPDTIIDMLKDVHGQERKNR
jgi:hypothetical protein